MLTLHVEAESFDLLVTQAWKSLGLKLKPEEPAKTITATDVVNAQPTEKKPVGRPKKEVSDPSASTLTPSTLPTTTQAPVPVGDDPFAATPSAPAKTITLEQVRGALQAHADKVTGEKGTKDVGIQKARAILAQFQSVKGTPCQKIAEVQDQDYPAILAACAA